MKIMKKQTGLGLIGVLLIIGALVVTAGGVLVWQRRALPTPTPTPTPAGICRTDDDCPKGYWCPTGPGGPMAGGGYGGGTGYCTKECQVDSDCGPGAFCQDIQFFVGDVGSGYRKGCQAGSSPGPKQEPVFPTEYSCTGDSDCVIKKRPFCCGESVQYYNWCYHRDAEPETISCQGVRSCPGVVPITSCVCQNGKCTAISTETEIQTDASNLHQPCGPNDQCPSGQRCISYYGVAGPQGPLFKTCEIPCPNGDSDCPEGFTCFAVSDGPGLVCKKTP